MSDEFFNEECRIQEVWGEENVVITLPEAIENLIDQYNCESFYASAKFYIELRMAIYGLILLKRKGYDLEKIEQEVYQYNTGMKCEARQQCDAWRYGMLVKSCPLKEVEKNG